VRSTEWDNDPLGTVTLIRYVPTGVEFAAVTVNVTRVRFAVPVGDYCIIIVDTGQTDLSVKMNAKIE